MSFYGVSENNKTQPFKGEPPTKVLTSQQGHYNIVYGRFYNDRLRDQY